MSKIKPVAHTVVLEVEKVSEKSEGGIHFLHEAVQREQRQATSGKIVAIGPTAFEFLKAEDRPKIGDEVFYKKYSGIDKTLEDKEYRIINDEDIYASLEEAKNE